MKEAYLGILNICVGTATPAGKLMLTVLASEAELELEIMLERQRNGSPRPRKKYKGGQPKAQAKADKVPQFAA